MTTAGDGDIQVQEVDGGTGEFNERVLRVQQLEEVIENISGAPPEAQNIINVALPVNYVLDEGIVRVEHVIFEETEENFTDGGS